MKANDRPRATAHARATSTLTLVALLLALLGCTDRPQDLRGGPHYFATWAGYGVPLRPVDTISLEEAKSRRAYYEAHFDGEGRLVRFVKYLDGQVDWSDTYQYVERRLVLRKLTKRSGEVVEQRFD